MKTKNFGVGIFSLKSYFALHPSAHAPPRRSPLAALALENYKEERKNGAGVSERGKLPGDGKYTWSKGKVVGNYVYGLEREDGYYDYEVRYNESQNDRAWMEANDRKYLAQLLEAGTLREKEPDVWYLRKMNKAQKIDIGEWWSQKLKSPNIGSILDNVQGARAFLMGAHPRLGKNSEVKRLDQNVMKKIAKFSGLFPPPSPEEAEEVPTNNGQSNSP